VADLPRRFSSRDGLRTIAVGTAVVSALPDSLRSCSFSSKIIVVSDRTVASKLFLPLKNALESGGFDVVAAFAPEGEQRKGLKATEELTSLLLEGGIGSNAGVLAFGGGSVADLAGFVAGTYLGSLPYVQIPTTLTAQLENLAVRRPALNHPQQKNLLTIEHSPCLVWNDLGYLESLPHRHRMSGLCTLVAGAAGRQATLFEFAEQHIEDLIRFDDRSIAEAVTLAAKSSVERADGYGPEGQTGPLPGDTIGDALQLAGRYRSVRYGEARLLGLLAEAYLARQSGVLASAEFDRLRGLAEALVLKVPLGQIKPWDVLRVLKYDSKAIIRRKEIPFLVRPGEVGGESVYDDSQLTEALRWILEWARDRSLSAKTPPTS